MRAAVVGQGAVGAAAAEVLLRDPGVESLTLVCRGKGHQPDRLAGLDPRVSVGTGLPEDADVVVVTVPVGAASVAGLALRRGAHVVTCADDPEEVADLLDLDRVAQAEGRSLVVGAAMAPGLSCVLAREAARAVDEVEEVHVASLGTGGPACAHRHHAALTSLAVDWNGDSWRKRPGGSGRELVWFPEPLGGADCYRAGLPDPQLLVPAFPGVRRVTARRAATRRDRTTAWLPMLRRPHPQGREGGVRVEVRGWSEGKAETEVLGAVAPPAWAAGVVSALAARWASAGLLSRPGAGGLASLVGDPGAFLREVRAAGVVVTRFEGVRTFASSRL